MLRGSIKKISVLKHALKEYAAEVALAGVRQNYYYCLVSKLLFLREANRGGDCGATGDPREQAFFASETARHLYRFLVGDKFHAVDDAEIEILRHKACADALNFVRSWPDQLSGQRLTDDRARHRLNRDRDDLLTLYLFDVARGAGDGSPGADAGDEHIDCAIGFVPDFRARGLEMNLRIRG